MYPDGGSFLWVISTVSIVWLLVISFFVFRQNLFLKKLFPDKKGDFKERLDESLRIAERLEGVRKKNLDNIQKIYLKRYSKRL